MNAADIMTQPVISVAPEVTIAEAARLMLQHRSTFGDVEIRAGIRAIIEKEPWGPRFSVDVGVKNGIAVLHGTITDERERTALRERQKTSTALRACATSSFGSSQLPALSSRATE